MLYGVGQAVTDAAAGYCSADQIRTIVAIALRGDHHWDHANNLAGGVN